MLSLVALGILAQQSVTVVPSQESPFIARDIKSGGFPQVQVVESKEAQKPGFFLIQQDGVDASTYERAAKDLEAISVSMLVRQNADKSYASWTATGEPFMVEAKEVPEMVRTKMKPGVIALYLRMPQRKMEAGRTAFDLIREWARVPSSSGKFVKYWTTLAVGSSKFVDVRFTVEGGLDVGRVKAVVGSQATIDGARFWVKQEMPNKGDGQECRCVYQTPKTKNQYLLKVEADWEAIQKALPNQLEFSSSTSSWIPPVASIGTPADTTEIFVSSTVPKQFWKEIIVVRHTVLTGFIGHLPTAPREAQ